MPDSKFEKYRYIVKFVDLLKPYRKNIGVFIVSDLILTVLLLPYPWLTKVLIDDVMLKQDASLLYIILIGTFLLTIVRVSLSAIRDYYLNYVHHTMSYDIRFRFFEHLQNLPFSFYDSRQTGEILSRLQDATQSRKLLTQTLNTLINNILYLTIVPFIVFMMNWKLALIAGFTLPWMIFSFFGLSKIIKRYTRLNAEKQAEMSSRQFEFISGIREIQGLRIEKLILKKIKRIYLQFRKLDMIIRSFGTVQTFSGAIVTAIGTLLYSWYAALLVIRGDMTIGELMAFTTLIGYLYNPLNSIIGLMVPIQEVLVHTKRFHEIYDLQTDIKDPVKPVKPGRIKGRITFDRVHFGYDAKQPVLNDINLEIRADMRIAIVGETGSGKSSLVNLIPRFYDPQSGSVRIDGIDVREFSLHDLRSSIGFIMQRPFIFIGTIYENISCGYHHHSREQIIAAAQNANAHGFISTLPNGYDTLVGENGVTLSGGERQRIALARAFLLDRPISILDEATSSVDQKTENEIQDALRRISKNRTTIVIAHRLSTIEDADLIVVMDKGQIVEQGVHRDLLKAEGHYFQLHHRVKSQTENPPCFLKA